MPAPDPRAAALQALQTLKDRNATNPGFSKHGFGNTGQYKGVEGAGGSFMQDQFDIMKQEAGNYGVDYYTEDGQDYFGNKPAPKPAPGPQVPTPPGPEPPEIPPTQPPIGIPPVAPPTTPPPAMQGLQSAFENLRGPSPGWDDEPATGYTAGNLGNRTPPMADLTLHNIVRRFGRAY